MANRMSRQATLPAAALWLAFSVGGGCHSFSEQIDSQTNLGMGGGSPSSAGAQSGGSAPVMSQAGAAGARALAGEPGKRAGHPQMQPGEAAGAGGVAGSGAQGGSLAFEAGSTSRGGSDLTSGAGWMAVGAGGDVTRSGAAGASGGPADMAGGVSGEAQGGGASSDIPSFCGQEETIFPACFADPRGYFPGIWLTSPRAIAIATEDMWAGFHIVVPQDLTSVVAITWGDDSGSVGWACFDIVPHPDRAAATSLSNDAPEIFVTTQCGQLYVRHYFADSSVASWGAWTPFSAPDVNSFIRDVALSESPEGVTHVYVVDRGRLFFRRRSDAMPYSAFGTWSALRTPASTRVAAGLRADGRQQLFALDLQGHPYTCIQSEAALGSAFEDCTDFGEDALPALTDIEAPYHVVDELPVFGLDNAGSLWLRELDTPDHYGHWVKFKPTDQPQPFIAIAAAGHLTWPGARLRLVAVGRNGSIYQTERIDDVWSAWQGLP